MTTTTNTEIKRVAEALFKVWRKRQDSEGKLSGLRSFQDATRRDRLLLYDQAIAAIQAIKDPAP